MVKIYPNRSNLSYGQLGWIRQLPRACRLRFESRPVRHFHSRQQPQVYPFTPEEDAILSAALAHVPTQGFTSAALRCGASDAGYIDASANLFPRGAFALVEYHLISKRQALRRPTLVSSTTSAPADVLTNLRVLIQQRLLANKPIIHRWQEALALLSVATNIPTAIKELALLSDDLLYLAGSTTVSTSWYTNRAALAAMYASTELFMTTDRSKDYVETQAFLERRLIEGESLRSSGEMVGKWAVMQMGGLVNGLRSKGVWI